MPVYSWGVEAVMVLGIPNRITTDMALAIAKIQNQIDNAPEDNRRRTGCSHNSTKCLTTQPKRQSRR
jgi:hypothetical protein